MKLLYLLPLVVFVVGVGAGKISEQENEEIQKICGRRTNGYSRKVINGEYVKKGEHPWAVATYVRYRNEKNQFNFVYGPGTMISSRHIITFNSLFYSSENLNINGQEYTGYKGICEGDNLIVPQELLSRYDADFEYLNDVNENREFRNTIAKVTVINGCKQLHASKPMILELVAPLENITVPVCISNSASNWERVIGFSVYGMNRPGRLTSGRFRPIECSASAPFSCAEASNKSSQGLCTGDYGGSAIANINHRHVMLGFYASGNYGCQGNTETMNPFQFVNLGYYRKEICETTGVCVPPPEEGVTPGPQTEAPSTTVGDGKLSEQENERTQMICGKRADGYHRKVINGEYVKKGEHPWAVTVYMRFLDKKNQFDFFYGVGTMISSRHIVKFNSLFNTGNNTDNLNLNGHELTGYKGICEGDNLIVPKELLPRFDADLENLNDVNRNREFRNTVAKVTVIHGCKELLTSNPMIIELVAPLDNNTVPACISNSAHNWERVDEFSVYGSNRGRPLVSGWFKPIECSASVPFSCAEASNKSQGLCNGDFGGSAIANMDHRHVMLGFYAGDNTDCQGNTETMDPFKFVNLGYYRQEICEVTGVCVRLPGEEVTPGAQPEAPSTTAAPEEDTSAHYSGNGEEIKAETFAPLKVSNSSTERGVTNNCGGEVIKAETFEPMEIDHRGSTRAHRIPDIHIHIHLNK